MSATDAGHLQGTRPANGAAALHIATLPGESACSAPGVSGVGLSSWCCMTFTGHVSERESNPQPSAIRPMLYPIELSKSDEPESNRPYAAEAVPSPVGTRRGGDACFPRLGIRHGKAARTGWVAPHTAVTCPKSIPDCGLSPIRNVVRRNAPCSLFPFRAPPALEHHHAAHMRRLQPRPRNGRAPALPGCSWAKTSLRMEKEKT